MTKVQTQTVNINLGFKPIPIQKDIIKAFKDENIQTLTLVASRQSGKTYLINHLIIYSALINDGIKILVLLPTQAQLQKNIKEIYSKLKKGEEILIQSKKESAGEAQIIFNNGSTIYFRSTRQKENLRGLSAISQIFVDEAAYVEFRTFQEVVGPMMVVKSKYPKKTVLLSTPRGRKNWLFNYFNREKEDNTYKSFKWNYKDNPHCDIDYIERERKNMPSEIFAQEYLGEFCETSGVFSLIEERCCLKPSTVQEDCIIGIDCGYKDYTVISVFNYKKQQIGLHYIQSDSTDEVIDFIVKSCKKYKYKKIYIEQNSIGKVFGDLIKKELSHVNFWITTQSSKREMVTTYITAFNNNEIQLINDDEQIYEHQTFLFIPDEGKFEGKSGSNDDIIIANSIAYYNLKKSFNKGNYIVI